MLVKIIFVVLLLIIRTKAQDMSTAAVISTGASNTVSAAQGLSSESIADRDVSQERRQVITFAEQFRIEKDGSDTSRLLNVMLPSPTAHKFTLFAARVIDISPVIDLHLRDANRTFSASSTDSAVINIHGLNPGHQYSIEVLGRNGHDTTLIKAESIVMDPTELNFASAEIRVHTRNITIIAGKPEKALQDMFRVEYIQRSPPKRFPILDVHDIEEQRQVELYLGNLSPGRDYDVVVTSMRGDLRSQLWKSLIATKPLSPANLSVTVVDDSSGSSSNSSCLHLKWTLPAESGADSFKIVYGQVHAQNDTQKAETTLPEIEICESILAGRAYVFAVAAVKSAQVSTPATILHVVRPLPARRVGVRADFDRGTFRVDAALPPLTLSQADHCQITVVSERAERFDQIITVNHTNSTAPSCTTWLSLVPGRRYEISVTVLGSGSFSTKTFINKAIEPGFDFRAFALSVKENPDLPDIRVEWPLSEVSMLRIADLWAKIVGNESRLHFTLSTVRSDLSAGDGEDVQQMETAPSEAPHPLIADHLRMGACYRVGLYTVSSSGIVSEARFEELLRLRVPRVGLVIGQLGSRSATINALFLKSVPLGASGGDIGDVPPPRISADCSLKVVVVDADAQVVYSHSLPLSGGGPPKIELTGLRPYFKYSINARTFCGSSRNESVTVNDVVMCPPKNETLDKLLFETNQDRPSAVRNLSIKALGPHTLEVAWLPPALRNGVLTHYIINIVPLGPSSSIASLPTVTVDAETTRNLPSRFEPAAKVALQLDDRNGASDIAGGAAAFAEHPWSVNVLAGDADLSADGGESILPRGGGDDASPLIVVLEARVRASLAGGRRYRISVVGVTAAGVGDLQLADEMPHVDMPIAAPPAPSATDGFRIDLMADSVRADRFGVTFSTAAFSAVNGAIIKLALVVAQVSADGSEPQAGPSAVTTWAHAQLYDVWPPYIAVEFADAGARFSDRHATRPLQITQMIGVDSNCRQRDTANSICNGPLRPAAHYRVRVRLFTSADQWSDSEPSDVIETEAQLADVSLGSVLGALALIGFTCAFLGSLVLAFLRRRQQRKALNASGKPRPPTDRASRSLDASKFFDCCYLNGAQNLYEAPAADNAHNYIVNGGFDVSDVSEKYDNRSPYASLTTTAAVNRRQQDANNNFYTKQQQQLNHGSNGTGTGSSGRQRTDWSRRVKMIMAKRGADCLAKLGLDGASVAAASYATRVTVAAGASPPPRDPMDASDELWQLNNGRAHTMAGGQPFDSPGAGVSAPSPINNNKVVTSTLSSPKHQLQPVENGQFNAHYRRSKSLRERTGVDQRLERLPSGPPAHKLLLCTVVRPTSGSGNEKSRPVRICDFPEHVRLMSADSDFRFSEEYEELRHVGVDQTSIAADLTINRAKNRFTNILPYDHSRVKLCSTNDDEDDGSDYVNASYIPGFNSRREFIAAQGPLPSTRDHFWRMVWEQQCPAIVALTKCVEKGRDKCHQYWPDNGQRSVLYADIEVTLVNECIEYDEFTIRELRLTNIADPGQPARTVQHLHYMAWPDFGVPEHPAGIVHFSRLFRNKLPPSSANRPTIVHCSAGVGRSGTFIALDRLVQNVELGRNIDVFGTVSEMRLERCHMVQNEQYIFIHHCLMFVLKNFYPHLIQRTSDYATAAAGSAASPLPGGGSVFFAGSPRAETMQLHQLRSFAPAVQPPPSVSSFKPPPEMPTIEVHHNPAFIDGDEEEDEDEGISRGSAGNASPPPSAAGQRVGTSPGQKHFNLDAYMM